MSHQIWMKGVTVILLRILIFRLWLDGGTWIFVQWCIGSCLMTPTGPFWTMCPCVRNKGPNWLYQTKKYTSRWERSWWFCAGEGHPFTVPNQVWHCRYHPFNTPTEGPKWLNDEISLRGIGNDPPKIGTADSESIVQLPMGLILHPQW